MKPERSDFVRALLRTLAIQGSWNYPRYQAGGLAYALLPLLRRIHAGHPVALASAVARHLEPFNGNPYLSPLVVGALARAEYEERDHDTIRRYRRALGSATGAAGDRLVWGGWRPFCLLAAVTAFAAGIPALWAAAGGLVAYNLGQLGLRSWAMWRGWDAGIDAARLLQGAPVQRLSSLLGGASAALVGSAVVGLGAALPASGWGGAAVGAAAVAAVVGYRWSARLGPVAPAALILACLAGLALG